MLPYFRSEIHRLVRRRMTVLLAVLMTVLPALIYGIIWLSVQAQLQALREGRLNTPQGRPAVTEESVLAALNDLRPDRAPEFAFGMAGVVGIIFIVILAGSVTGNEFGWSTVRTVLAHGGRRAAFIFGKIAALVLASGVFVVLGFVGTFVAAYGIGIVASLDLSLSGDAPARVISYGARTVYVALPYLTFSVFMAVIARSATAGVAFGLVLFFGETLLVQLAIQLSPDLRPLFDAGIVRNVGTINRASGAGQGPPVVLPSATEFSFAVLILALYVIAFVSLTIHRFSRRDLTLA